ncbi:diguanylate phosphodiesterase [Betaproteobacteria bacterium]|nr:diguanylate phosphodiesterase [Betaproteobacteria bacterium]
MENQWALESVNPDGVRSQFLITQLPCQIGRSKDNDLVISDLGLSRVHATLTTDITGRMRLTDENTTNGTFVNRNRVEGYCLLKKNDIIHFAGAEFKLRLIQVEQHSVLPFDQMNTMFIGGSRSLSEHFAPNETEFDELLTGQGLSGAIQPIVNAQTRQIFAYELLGRSNHPNLPKAPIDLFSMARSMDREAELSSAFREFGINKFAPHLEGKSLFFNAHPNEMFSGVFMASLEQVHSLMPKLRLVVEVHESAVTNIKQLRGFTSKLASMDMRFAYDDFGAGQARLLELADVPADFVKFDIALVRGLHMSGPRKRQVVKDLVQMVLSSGSIPLAEGIESEEDAKVCVAMGFKLIQGYLTGKPIPAELI